jgi:hypothetical protein
MNVCMNIFTYVRAYICIYTGLYILMEELSPTREVFTKFCIVNCY